MLNELIAAIYSLLSGDATLLASGIVPSTGGTRAVAIVGEGAPGQSMPFVRVSLTDSNLAEPDAEPHDYTTQPTTERVMLLVNVFSDNEPEVRKVATRLKELLRHAQVTTTNYQGFTWWDSGTFYTDNVSNPDQIVRVCSIRVRCILEPR